MFLLQRLLSLRLPFCGLCFMFTGGGWGAWVPWHADFQDVYSTYPLPDPPERASLVQHIHDALQGLERMAIKVGLIKFTTKIVRLPGCSDIPASEHNMALLQAAYPKVCNGNSGTGASWGPLDR